MTYLLAKYALLFLVALISGFLFGRWMTGKSFIDVSDNYEDLRDAATRSDSAQWERLWGRLDALPSQLEMEPVDITPIRDQLGTIEKQIRAKPRPQDVNLAPVDERLGAIELELTRLGRRLEVAPQANVSAVGLENTGPVTFQSASFGDKDNLRRISGVGSMLENLLNDHGVFYFWQVANWTNKDIDVMDERLDTFKGRIARDNWVEQARRLGAEPDSAQQPTEMRISA